MDHPLDSRSTPSARDAAAPAPADATPPGKKRRRKRKRASHVVAPPSVLPTGLSHAVRDAMETLRWSAHALARSRGLEGKLDGIDLRLRLGRNATPDALAEAFFREMLARLDEAQCEETSVVPNRAYCFRCDSFLCAHSRPESPGAVLSAYEPTGRPVWIDLVSLAIARRDARTEEIAARSSGVIAIIEEGAAVTRDRIEAFGGARPTIEILAQVMAGPFRVASESGRDDECALTVQILAVRRPQFWKIVLHPIGDARLLEAVHASDQDLARILASSRAALQQRHGRRGAKPSDAPDAAMCDLAMSLAHNLARDLQHHYHVLSRRTRHAVERAEIGVRPTSHAFPEARRATDDSIFIDQKTGTFVLLGKNARVHFFNDGGKHVSSVRFDGESIRARKDTGRWRAALPPEIARFRSHFSGEARRGAGGPQAIG